MRMLDISPYYLENMVLTMGSTLDCQGHYNLYVSSAMLFLRIQA